MRTLRPLEPDYAKAILRACNSHEALVEALRQAQYWLEVECAITPETTHRTHGPSDALKAVYSALTLATGQEEGR